VSLEQVPMWRVVCDRCGESAQQDEFYAWADHGSAIDEATGHDWLVNDKGEWCPDCTIEGPDGEDIPNPEPLPEPEPKPA